MNLTAEERLDLRAIMNNPGCYSKVLPGTCRELHILQNERLIQWSRKGGYFITAAGRAALQNAGKEG